MRDASLVVGKRESVARWVGVVVAVGSVLLGGSLGAAALVEANAAPLAGGSVHG